MLKLCEDIETLAMMLCDGELADSELRDVELHLLECAACRGHVERERTVLGELRTQLAAPAAPDLLRQRISRALDDADRARRPSWRTWALPGAAAAAAAAALAVFVLGNTTPAPTPADNTVPGHRVAARAQRAVALANSFSVAGPREQIDFRLVGTEAYSADVVALHYAVRAPDDAEYDLHVVVHRAAQLTLDARRRRLVGGFEVWDSAPAADGLVVRDGERAIRLSSTTLSVADLKLLIGSSSLVARIGADDPRR